MNGSPRAASCGVCGTSDSFLFECDNCGRQYCSAHRGEDAHSCNVSELDAKPFHCDHCGDVDLLFVCEECGHYHCDGHRSPADHACSSVEASPEPSTGLGLTAGISAWATRLTGWRADSHDDDGGAQAAQMDDAERLQVDRRGVLMLATTVAVSGATALQLGRPTDEEDDSSSGIDNLRWGYGGAPMDTSGETSVDSGLPGKSTTTDDQLASTGGSAVTPTTVAVPTSTSTPQPTDTPSETTSSTESAEGTSAGGGGGGSGGGSASGGGGGGGGGDSGGDSTSTTTTAPPTTTQPSTTATTVTDEYGVQGYGEYGYGG